MKKIQNDGVARAKSSLLELCRVVTEIDYCQMCQVILFMVGSKNYVGLIFDLI